MGMAMAGGVLECGFNDSRNDCSNHNGGREQPDAITARLANGHGNTVDDTSPLGFNRHSILRHLTLSDFRELDDVHEGGGAAPKK
jgi:hypothetical protein